LNKFLSIFSILFFYGCGDSFNQDVDGPFVSLIYPEAGYVASDSVEIRFEVSDKSQVFKMNLRIFGNGFINEHIMSTEFTTPNIFYFMLDVINYEPGSIIIQGVGEDEFGNEGFSTEIEIFVDNTLDFINIPSGVYLDSDNVQSQISYDYQMMTYPVTLEQYLIYLNEAFESEEIMISDNKIRGLVDGTMRDFIAWGDSSNLYHLGAITMEENQFIAMDSSYNKHPITGVSWYGAKAFAENYKMRLPSVAEWEKVARGVSGYIYPWGNYNNEIHSNFDESEDPWEPGTTPVGYFNGMNGNFDSKSPFGAYDMAGNVWEWSTDYIIGEGYVLKGGSYQNLSFTQTTISETTSFAQYLREHYGFRCVRNL
tara:strand:+ start:13292 stop:14395 length:1104 start_codon:yes stop_codon:yes gene_type:complete